MAKAVALQAQDGRPVCEQCLVADRPLARMRGLLGRKVLPPGEGLLLRPAASVHTFFMRFPIDVVFLDADLKVLRVVHSLGPWRVAAMRGAKYVVELAAGECERRALRAGDQLVAAGEPGLRTRAHVLVRTGAAS